MSKNCILFSICSLGLGHASRSLPLIKELLKENKLVILSDGNALRFLKEELKDFQEVIFYEKSRSYPPLEEGTGFFKYNYHLIKDSISTIFTIFSERNQTKEICNREKVNLIISDGNYGSFVKSIPSILITHQIEFQIKNIFYKKVSSLFNLMIFKRYNLLIIPDYPSNKDNLAGDLSHTNLIKKIPHIYSGVISQFKKVKTRSKINYLVIISGFLHEHKEEFFLNILKELQQKKGKKVFIMGDYKKDYKEKMNNNIEIYSSFKGLNKNELFNSSDIIISRTGYSTIMDLIEIDKKAILIPTPHQSEQEYLAEYHKDKRFFNIIKSQKQIDLKIRNLKIPLKNLHKTKDSIKIIMGEINKLLLQYNDS